MKIICIGQNYIEHIKELNSAIPDEPVFFLKPDTTLLLDNKPFYLPDFSNDIHYEVEIVLKINHIGKNISEKFAHKYYDEITVGIDFTARDIQKIQKIKGLPWEKAKAFDYSAPIGKFVPKNKFDRMSNLIFFLNINDKTVQKGNTNNMLFSFDKIISFVSQFITLRTGDLIYTGTPVGVGPVKIGDKLEAFLEEEKLLGFYVK
ncbi:MAG: fumarylacetoacetate hydrolase family protein [Bacteroidota bacterium]